MKSIRNFAQFVAVVLALTVAHTALADQHKMKGQLPKGEISQAVELEATVTAIDLKHRMVTLKGPDGNETTLQVGKQARNLSQVKVGDVVKVAYVQHVAWQVRQAGAGAPSADVSVEQGAVRAEAGEKPAGAVGQRVGFTATIEAIDLGKHTVTLKGPEGNSVTVKARNPANLKKVKVGDLVDIAYTEAVAIKVDEAPK